VLYLNLTRLIRVSKKLTAVSCYFALFRSEYLFNFDRTFEIHDDIEVLKRMGLSLGLEKGQCSPADLVQALKMVPKSLEPYVKGLSRVNLHHMLQMCAEPASSCLMFECRF